MGKLIQFSATPRRKQPARSYVAEPNQHVRQSYIRQFVLGKSVMAIARQNKVQMRLIENAVRREIYDLRAPGAAA